ncbi:diguanylate cyclase [Methylobacterium sp. Leaf104]|uniref:GGDEF domain-containing protein n=1 Tax=Methylobacterium TaxID=407 RepID=UPI0006FF8A6B|nr:MULTISPECIES: GGDEF domain-containing protein [Methylobacterium]KQP42538.1 diguanylate cyclase [Methylobacterium sp. Leaf104]MCI9878919.1 diguanylate cyclase [Methylobacterium goesingense]
MTRAIRAVTDGATESTPDSFSLYDAEEAVLTRTEAMLSGLSDVAGGVQALADAYRRGYREQRRLVRMSDRMQLDLQKANHCLAEQRRDLQALNAALSSEIEHRTRLEAELRRLADIDDLTGALARRRFMEVAAREWLRHGRSGAPVCILMLDLDRFKLLNDSFGHAAGDAALVSFVATCRASLRTLDFIGRTGGEEFAIVLSDTGLEAGFAFAERLREAVAATPVPTMDAAMRITVSIGVAQAEAGESLEAAMQRADASLYAAKDGGRNRVALRSGAPDAPGGATRR